MEYQLTLQEQKSSYSLIYRYLKLDQDATAEYEEEEEQPKPQVESDSDSSLLEKMARAGQWQRCLVQAGSKAPHYALRYAAYLFKTHTVK